jgi:hypothetical protein
MTDPNKAFDAEHEPFWFAKAESLQIRATMNKWRARVALS